MIKETLYAKYLTERNNTNILENETGFVAYIINNSDCFIADMFINKENRASGKARALICQLEEIALKNSCEKITGNIHLWDSGASNTLLAALNIGFNIIRADQNILLISKKISGGT